MDLGLDDNTRDTHRQISHHFQSLSHRPPDLREKNKHAVQVVDEYHQSTLWWFTSVAFPLIAGTFGPIANLFSICGLVQSWRITKPDGFRVADPGWLLALNIVSLVLALLANLLLLFNFAKRIPYRLAQPFTILFWYLSSILLLIPICIAHTSLLHQSPTYSLSQCYYYALISCILYFLISTLLSFNLLGSSPLVNAYPPSFAQLSRPQRTLMLQTILFSAYLALGGGIFSAIEGWEFVDGVYWADYTLLTIGLGSDFPVTRTLGRMLLLPYAAMGIVFVGLIVSSVRDLVLERGRARITKRRLEKERKRWTEIMDIVERDEKGQAQEQEGDGEVRRGRRKIQSGKDIKRFLKARKEAGLEEVEPHEKVWKRREFELMRHIESSAHKSEGYIALAFSAFVFVVIWIGGSLVFWACETSDDEWTYPVSLYFTYTSILTIGYGDFFPTTTSTRPFFVIWSLVAVPAVTVLIANMGETVLKGVNEGVFWIGRRSWLLPERVHGPSAGDEKARAGEDGVGEVQNAEAKFGWIRGEKEKKKKRKHAKSSIPSQHQLQQNPEAQNGITPTLNLNFIADQTHPPPSLTTRLSREITHLSKDASQIPPKRYSWPEWVKWLKLMDEAAQNFGITMNSAVPDSGRKPPLHRDRLGEASSSSSQGQEEGRYRRRLVPRMQGQGPGHGGMSIVVDGVIEGEPVGIGGEARMRESSERMEESGNGNTGASAPLEEVWRWNWLDDQGPLFSSETETQWVLNKLCTLLEKVVEREIEIQESK